jgi:hypothetical protein
MPGGLMVAAMNTAENSALCMISAPVRSSKPATLRSTALVIVNVRNEVPDPGGLVAGGGGEQGVVG